MDHNTAVDEISKAIRGNSPERVCEVLHEHYRWLGKESLRGLTPNPDLSQFWRGVSSAFGKLATSKVIKQTR